jgi:hypothetical protein
MPRLTKKMKAHEAKKLAEWEEKVKKMWPHHKVRARGSIQYGTVTFSVEGSDSVDLSFADLCKISEMLGGTKMINMENSYFPGGCDTCDYGAVYEVDICCSEAVYGEPE